MDKGNISSEVGKLESVLVHRPGPELDRITPDTMEEMLFDELIWLEEAVEEHDAFTEILWRSGSEVLYVSELLTELAEEPEARTEMVNEQVADQLAGRRTVERLRSHLVDLPAKECIAALLGGVTIDELGLEGTVLHAVSGPNEFVLPPLPNTLFTRDSSIWIANGVVISPMNRPARRRESSLLSFLYRNHPRFSGTPIWFGDAPGEAYPVSVEGGDVLVLSERGIAVGLSERTTAAGVAALSGRLFEQEVVDRILVVELPKARATMHLDTVVTMAATTTAILYPRAKDTIKVHRIVPGAGGIPVMEEADSTVSGLAWAAGLDDVDTIEPPLDSFQGDREQWNDANNVFAIAPGEVVAYERNVVTNNVLRDAGIKVHTMPSYELPRGRGGPRCMTCPISRAALGAD